VGAGVKSCRVILDVVIAFDAVRFRELIVEGMLAGSPRKFKYPTLFCIACESEKFILLIIFAFVPEAVSVVMFVALKKVPTSVVLAIDTGPTNLAVV
jgi:hypothetical protein